MSYTRPSSASLAMAPVTQHRGDGLAAGYPGPGPHRPSIMPETLWMIVQIRRRSYDA